MDIAEFETILKVGEHIGVEFKTAKGGAKDDTFETVCSFLNRFGGDIFLGVTDTCEVASKALRCGPVTPDNLAPVSKNPIIARFFKQMGRADELGSGTRNLYHYTRLYSNADPILEEGDAFQVTVPLDDEYSVDQFDVRQTEGGTPQNTPQNAPQKPDQKFDRPDQKPDQNPDQNPDQKSSGAIPECLQDAPSSVKSVYEAIRENSRVTYRGMAAMLGLNKDTVNTAVALLTKKGLLRRVGEKKNGHWEVLQ